MIKLDLLEFVAGTCRLIHIKFSKSLGTPGLRRWNLSIFIAMEHKLIFINTLSLI